MLAHTTNCTTAFALLAQNSDQEQQGSNSNINRDSGGGRRTQENQDIRDNFDEDVGNYHDVVLGFQTIINDLQGESRNNDMVTQGMTMPGAIRRGRGPQQHYPRPRLPLFMHELTAGDVMPQVNSMGGSALSSQGTRRARYEHLVSILDEALDLLADQDGEETVEGDAPKKSRTN